MRIASLRVGGGAVFLSVWLGLSVGCYRGNQYVSPPPPDVTVARPLVKDVPTYAEFTGTTKAHASVEIRARVQGYLDSIHFSDDPDTEVAEGDLLFVIDPRPYQAKLDAAKADLESKKAMVTKTYALYRRTIDLMRKNAAAPEEVDKEKGNWEVAKADVLQAQANLREAQLNLGFTKIHAPMSGKISRHLLDVGNLVTADNTILTNINQYDPMDVYFNVSEGDLLEFMRLGRQKGQRLNQESAEDILRTTLVDLIGLLAAPGAPAPLLGASVLGPKVPRGVLELALTNEQGFPHRGRMDYVDLGVDAGTGTIQVRGIFPNPKPHVLLPGMFVRIRAPIGVHEGALLVSERAIGADQTGRYVLVVDSDNKVERRPVKLGVLDKGMRVIEEGLRSDERVIIKGLQRAIPGSKVHPIDADERPSTAK
jgi:RND family efflux transporter MFP subunit